MEMRLYSIRDVKTGFLPLTVDYNDASAIRNFRHACLNTQSLFFTFPADYSLCHIGDFDTDTGEITPCMPTAIAYAIEFVKDGDVDV